jgi:guanylate kinase
VTTTDSDPLTPYLSPQPVLLALTGPSGVGKDSILQEMRTQGGTFAFVVTATDRAQRAGETEGLDYYFVSTAEFERMIRDDELLEHAFVYNQYKGVPRAQVRQALLAGRDVVLRVDVQGAQTLRTRLPGIVTVFLAPPSLDALAQRLHGRGTDTPTQVETRLRTARAEIALADEFDYVVVNWEGRLDEAARQVLAILEAEKRRTRRPQLDL